MNLSKLLITQAPCRSLTLAALISLVTPYANTFAANIIEQVAVKGATLADSSAQYLARPGQYLARPGQYLARPGLLAEIRKQNSAIEHSSRLLRNTRLKVEKRLPKIRASKLNNTITTIDPNAIAPFLRQSLLLNDDSLKKAGYVLQGTRKQMILGKGSEIFASGVNGEVDQPYQLFRIGKSIIDVKTQANYGIEAVYIGSATMLESGAVATLYITDSNQEIRPGDRITAMTKPSALPRYFPRKPNNPIETYVTMIPRGVAEAGRRDIAVIVGGEDRGLEAGHVLRIYSDSGTTKDPTTGKTIDLPPLEIGAAMVFQVHEKISYVIIMSSTDPIKLGDKVVSP